MEMVCIFNSGSLLFSPRCQAAQESIRRRQESEKNRSVASTNGVVPPQAVPKPPRMTKAVGWLPSSDSQSAGGGLKDPLLQQIDNIQSFLRQAREARRADEVAMLGENLRQLQDEYDQQQTSLAIALSQKLAREENLQQGEIQRLEARERSERERRAPAADSRPPPSVWECSLDLGEPGPGCAGEENKTPGEPTPKFERSPLSLRAFPPLAGQEESPPRLRSLGGHVTPPSSEEPNSSSLNPFDEDDSTPAEDTSNPFFEDIQEEHKEVSNGKREYNPFDDEQEGSGAEEGRTTTAQRGRNNPFEEDSGETGNPFAEACGDSPGVPTNPFEGDEDAGALASDIEMIEEELLLQQIDNIRAYIFDAKINGRLDEVELLSTNLRELQHTLQEQKKAH